MVECKYMSKLYNISMLYTKNKTPTDLSVNKNL